MEKGVGGRGCMKERSFRRVHIGDHFSPRLRERGISRGSRWQISRRQRLRRGVVQSLSSLFFVLVLCICETAAGWRQAVDQGGKDGGRGKPAKVEEGFTVIYLALPPL
ncbi:ATP-dependent DNA helicase Q-like 5 isoform X1 [Gossypium australe]|uniref:ATP-dependent DNA helicase Q-like 5 isoform X1 n=1 Tax=Gossypium australe TaxID=47621 RepID=A0A5B6V9F2_9ROSI|nr:ATP-dependent DNA helicase Q-like 5 isoform X1 [Gossypium australe]